MKVIIMKSPSFFLIPNAIISTLRHSLHPFVGMRGHVLQLNKTYFQIADIRLDGNCNLLRLYCVSVVFVQ
jgi:hypothetical protein